MARKSEIGDRIAQINSVAAEHAAVTVEGLIAECDEAMALAREVRNPTAMVAAIKEKGVLSGKRVERSERGAPVAPEPVYVAPPRRCYWTRGEPTWDEYRGAWVRPRLQVCNPADEVVDDEVVGEEW